MTTAHMETKPLAKPVPFDQAKLDGLMDKAGIDVLVVTSKHNVQYLLGGYRFFFFDFMDAIGVSRYLPVMIYRKGRPDQAAYFGNGLETYERQLDKFWPATVETKSWGTLDVMKLAGEHLKRLGPLRTIGVEMGFLPADAHAALRETVPNSEIVDALFTLERLRAVKTPDELDLLRQASEGVVSSMLAVMGSHGPGATKRQLTEALRLEEIRRGLTFEYCLITVGKSHNRSPSPHTWNEGEVLSLDSGGNFKGYIGDLCRMAFLGEPDQELKDLLAEIDMIQQAARRPIRAGARGADIYVEADKVFRTAPHKDIMHFCAHGMGMIPHEAPRLTGSGPVPYPGYDADLPLEAGMVVSIETTLPHPRRGYVKLEDTVAVTNTGYEPYGDAGRGWNRGKV
ncbi:MAG: M24 family metallopeptidase [Parvibaculaceae bacterium]